MNDIEHLDSLNLHVAGQHYRRRFASLVSGNLTPNNKTMIDNLMDTFDSFHSSKLREFSIQTGRAA